MRKKGYEKMNETKIYDWKKDSRNWEWGKIIRRYDERYDDVC